VDNSFIRKHLLSAIYFSLFFAKINISPQLSVYVSDPSNCELSLDLLEVSFTQNRANQCGLD
jgi:hypothetical protein